MCEKEIGSKNRLLTGIVSVIEQEERRKCYGQKPYDLRIPEKFDWQRKCTNIQTKFQQKLQIYFNWNETKILWLDLTLFVEEFE